MVLIALTLLIISAGLAQAEWVSFDGRDQNRPEINLMSSDNNGVVFHISIPGMNVEPSWLDPSYFRLSLPEGESLEEPGAPELPVITVRLAIPSCDDVDLEVASSNILRLRGYRVNPAPERNGMVNSFARDDSLYATSEFYPENIASYQFDQFRDQHLVEVKLSPIRCSPATGQLEIWQESQVTVRFVNPSGPAQRDVGIFNAMAGQAIINYQMPQQERTGFGSWAWSPVVPGLICDYLVIVGNKFADSHEDSAKIEELAAHRASLNGFAVKIVRVGDIPGWTNWLNIKNFLADVYHQGSSPISSDGHLPFVLLVGDAWDDTDENGQRKQPPFDPLIPRTEAVPVSDLSFASDFWYANVDSAGIANWQDLSIGRLPAGTYQELSNVIYKIISYETTPVTGNWKNSIALQGGTTLCVGGDRDWTYDSYLWNTQESTFGQMVDILHSNTDYHVYLSYDHTNGQGPLSATTVPADDIHQSCFVWPNPDLTDPREVWTGPIMSGNYQATTAPNPDGAFICGYLGHGTLNTSLAFWYLLTFGDYFGLGQEGTDQVIQNSDGRWPLFLLTACYPGYFDYDSTEWAPSWGNILNDSFAEQFLVKDLRGTIAVLCPVKMTYTMSANVQTYYTNFMFGDFATALPNSYSGLIGPPATMAANLSSYGRHYTLFGDPGTNILIQPTGGAISQNTVWSGRVDIIDNLLVPQGITLAIEPGANVVLHNNCWLKVEGAIMAQGTAGNPIKFQGGATPGYGLVLTNNTEPSSVISNCQFERLKYGIEINTNTISPITWNTFKNCDWGIYANNSNVDILNSSFDSCGVGIYYTQGYGAIAEKKILGNAFAGCDSIALILLGSDFITVEENCFELPDGATGIWAFGCNSLAIKNNVLAGGNVGVFLEDCYCPTMLNNEVNSAAWSDLDFWNTSPDMGFNNLHDGFGQGMRLFADSEPIMSHQTYNPFDQNGQQTPIIVTRGYNSIYNHSAEEIWIDGFLLPGIYNGHNNIHDSGGGPPTIPLILANLAGLPADGYMTSVAGNWWGENVTDTLEARQKISPQNFARLFEVWVETVDSVENIQGSGGPNIQIRYTGQLEGGITQSAADLQGMIEEQEAIIRDPNSSARDSVMAVIKIGSAYLTDWLNSGQSGKMRDRPLLGSNASLRPADPVDYLIQTQGLLNWLSGMSGELPGSNASLLPQNFALHQNYPNPFNPSTNILFDLPQTSKIFLEVYNLMGQKVASLVDGWMEAGSHHITWEATDIASGVYFCALNTQGFNKTIRMVIIK